MMDASENLLRLSDQIRSNGFDLQLMGGFLVAFAVAGFCIWIFAFCSQPRGRSNYKESCLKTFCLQQRTSIQIVHNALTSMLIMDVANIVISVLLGGAMILHCENESMCDITSVVFFITRGFGVIYHLVVALLSIFHLCHPSQGSHHRFTFTAVSVFIIVLCPVYVYFSDIAVILVGIITLGLALIIMIKSKTPVASPFSAKTKILIVSVALFTFWTVFFPSFVIQCLILSGRYDNQYIHLEVLYYTSFIVIMDGVLCRLVFGLYSEEQEMQQQQPPPQWQQPLPQWQQPAPQWQQPPPQWQQPPPQWQQPPPQWQQPPPQWQQPPPQWQQPPPKGQQPPPQWQHRNGTENSGFTFS